MSAEDNGTSPKRSTRSAFVIVGIIGSLASLISIPLAIYFYEKSRERPELTFYVHPVKAVLLQSGKVSRLTANYENKPIESDVTTTQIALWNEGSQSIRSTGVLEPIIIQSENGVPILEATVRKSSRDVTRLTLGTDELSKGRVSVSWNILESGDGGVIQLIYAGPPSVRFSLTGVIEGQRQISQRAFLEKIKSPEEQYDASKKENRRSGLGFLFMSMFLASLCVLLFFLRPRVEPSEEEVVMSYEEVDALIKGDEAKLKEYEEMKNTPLTTNRKPVFFRIVKFTILIGSIVALGGIGLSLFFLYLMKEPGPPFGF